MFGPEAGLGACGWQDASEPGRGSISGQPRVGGWWVGRLSCWWSGWQEVGVQGARVGGGAVEGEPPGPLLIQGGRSRSQEVSPSVVVAIVTPASLPPPHRAPSNDCPNAILVFSLKSFVWTSLLDLTPPLEGREATSRRLNILRMIVIQLAR